MADCNRFEPLRTLPMEVLEEVVREGEARVVAQLDAAKAADQRALTIAGFQITSATAALGGGIALAIGEESDLWLSVLALLFASIMALCAREAILSARPQLFHFPGNRPNGWLPGNWLDGHSRGFTLQQARIEQAACLDEVIEDNAISMRMTGKRVEKSLDWSIIAIGTAAALLFGTFVARNLTIREPTSEIVRLKD